MKKNYRSGNPIKCITELIVCFFMLCMLALSCNNVQQIGKQNEMEMDSAMVYYCPMHSDVEQVLPGTCPKPECKGMKLVRKPNVGEPENIANAINTNVLSTIKTIHPVKMMMDMTIKADGYVDFDNRTKHNIASRYTGRIEKLYIKNNYEFIIKGERIFDVYSPELITLQQNLIYLLSNQESKELLEDTQLKLKLLGFTDAQINELIKTRKVLQVVPVFSKFSGHVHEMLDVRQPQMDMENRQQTNMLTVKEGMYVERGKSIFNIVDAKALVVILKINARDVSKLFAGQEVNYILNDFPGMLMKGKIDFIESTYQQGAKSLTVRVNMDNREHHHKVGSLVKAQIKVEKVDGLWIPPTAVLDLGMNKMVWLKKNGNFIARKIDVGVTTNEWIEVYDGLTKNDEIAAEAHYLNDSESIIKIKDEQQ